LAGKTKPQPIGRRPGNVGRRAGLVGRLALAFGVVAAIPLATALVASLWVLAGQSAVVESEVLWSKAKLAALVYENRRDALGRALTAASRDNGVLVSLELGLREALPAYLAELAELHDLDGVWISGADGRYLAGAGSAAPDAADAPDSGAPAAGAAPVFALAGGADEIPALIGTIALSAGDGRTIGRLHAAVRLARLAEEIAAIGKTPAFFVVGRRLWIRSPDLSAADGATEAAGLPRLPAGAFLPAAGADPVRSAGTILGVRYRLALVPLAEGSGDAGLGIAFPEAKLNEARDRGLVAIVGAGLLALLLAWQFAARFRRSITMPVLELAGAARSIANGFYGRVVDPSADDEIGDLTRDFNRMSGRLAEQENEREAAAAALRASERQFRSIFDGVGDAIFIHDIHSGAIVDGNLAVADIFGLSVEEVRRVGVAGISENVPPYDGAAAAALMAKAAAGARVVTEWRSRRGDGSLFWSEVSIKRSPIGGVDRIVVTCRDVDARRRAERAVAESLKEKEILLKEIHHRVKNNFQIINSLFDLQLFSTEDPVIQNSLREPKARIHAMALIHERLYQSGDLSTIDFASYLDELARELHLSYNADPDRIGLVVEAEPSVLDMDRAIPCGLVLNELITNALKYAFPDPGRRGTVTVRLRRAEGFVELAVEDDGAGFDAPAASEDTRSLGLTLARILAEQLRGSFALNSGPAGTKAVLRFPG
jgi:PAS domain S-box-containing protein